MLATRFPGAGGIRALQLGNEKRTPALVQTLAPLWANQVTPPSAIPSSGMGLGQWDGTRPSPLVVGTPPISVGNSPAPSFQSMAPVQNLLGFSAMLQQTAVSAETNGVRREKGVAPKRRVARWISVLLVRFITQEPAFRRKGLLVILSMLRLIGTGDLLWAIRAGMSTENSSYSGDDPAIVPRQLGQGTELEAGRIPVFSSLPLWLQGQPNIAAQASRMEWLTSSPQSTPFLSLPGHAPETVLRLHGESSLELAGELVSLQSIFGRGEPVVQCSDFWTSCPRDAASAPRSSRSSLQWSPIGHDRRPD